MPLHSFGRSIVEAALKQGHSPPSGMLSPADVTELTLRVLNIPHPLRGVVWVDEESGIIALSERLDPNKPEDGWQEPLMYINPDHILSATPILLYGT